MRPKDHPRHQIAALDRIKAVGPKSIVARVPSDPKSFDMVVCHCCRTPIRKMVPDDRYEEHRVINGQNVTIQRLIMVSLPGYAEVKIAFDDGSAHVHCMCKDCANDPNLDLEALYAHVLHDWLIEEQLAGGPVRWDLVAHRKPIKVISVSS